MQRGGVPFGAGFADVLSSGECFGRRGGEACASEAMRGVAESGEHLGAAFGYHENTNTALEDGRPYHEYGYQ